MRVLIDGSNYSENPSGGVFNYLNEFLIRLPQVAGVEEIELITKRVLLAPPPKGAHVSVKKPWLPSASWIPSGRVRTVLSRIKQGLESQIWKARFQNRKDQVFHSISYVDSPNPHLPKVTNIYDLITEKFPDLSANAFGEGTRARKLHLIRSSTRFIAISNHTRNDLCETFDIAPDRVDVIHLGINLDTFSEQEAAKASLERFRIAKPYLLYVGGRLNHKKLPRFLEAYATSHLCKDFSLIATQFPWESQEEDLLRKYKVQDRVTLALRVNQPELNALYRGATAFIYPSLYEGFGMPLLEAMACGCPIAAANISSLPEVAGDAASYFDPKEPLSMVAAIEKLLDSKAAQQFREKGLARVKQFSWDKTIEKTVVSYLKTLEMHSA